MADSGQPGGGARADRLRNLGRGRRARPRGAAPGAIPRLANRLRLAVGLRRRRKGDQSMKELRNFIGGQWADPASGVCEELINPSTGETFATAPVSGQADVDAAFGAAAEAFETWRDATPSERSLALLRIADALDATADEFVAAESENTGKPVELTKSEQIPPMIHQTTFFAAPPPILEH